MNGSPHRAREVDFGVCAIATVADYQDGSGCNLDALFEEVAARRLRKQDSDSGAVSGWSESDKYVRKTVRSDLRAWDDERLSKELNFICGTGGNTLKRWRETEASIRARCEAMKLGRAIREDCTTATARNRL